jgi:CRISPR/Cas system endoribonuclease Cas6 (RAMP superfamily)
MELTEMEKKLLTALHNTKLHNWEFYPHYKEFLEEYISFEELDLKKVVDKFAELGLLKIVELGEGVVLCKHTDEVTSEMLDEELVHFGYDYGFENTQ